MQSYRELLDIFICMYQGRRQEFQKGGLIVSGI